MKNFKILILLFSSIFSLNSSYSQTNWFWQNPLPQGNELKEVRFFNQNTGMAVGTKGTIIKTTNSGLSWNIQTSNTFSDLYNLNFISIDKIIVCGNSGTILNTSDGGTNWTFSILDINIKLTGIDFTSTLNGWISGYDISLQVGKIYKTTNGGINWILNFSTSNELNKIKFINENSGWSDGGYGLFKTTNGGVNWNLVNNYAYSKDFTFKDSLNGIIVGDYTYGSTLYGFTKKTTNGGINFANLFEYRDSIINSVNFCNSNTGFASGNKGKILKTTNFGDNWFNITNSSNNDLNSIFFQNDSIGWSVGKGGEILKTNNQGLNWSQLNSGSGSDLVLGQFLNLNTSFLSGQKLVLKTSNGGNNWFNIWDSVGGNDKSNIVYFKNENEGWLSYPNGDKIYKTINGGINWTFVGRYGVGGYNYFPFSMYFLNDNKGFIVGQVLYYTPPGIEHRDGFLLGTNDGGNNWSIITLPSSGGSMNDIKFFDDLTGIIVGGNSSIVKTTNGGNNWFTAITLFDSFNYRKIKILNANTGWLFGNDISGPYNNKICRTTNAGVVWYNTSGQIVRDMYNFDFSDENNGWMCGKTGGIYASSNRGSNWIKQESPTGNNLYIINFQNQNTGWVAGGFSTILKTTSGISPVFVNNQKEIHLNDFILNQNYPNPFNPTTVISYQLSLETHNYAYVLLKVYDALGKEIATLVNEKQNAGSYTVEFKGEGLPSGVYFYKLEVKSHNGGIDFTETKKMILLK